MSATAVKMPATAVMMPSTPVRILLADDQVLIRETVAKILKSTPNFEVIGQAINGLDAVNKAMDLKPDVIVLNIRMPILDGLEAARRIHQHLPKTAIVILSSDMDERLVDEAKKIGARAYVPKEEAGNSLINAIQAAIKNEDFFVVPA